MAEDRIFGSGVFGSDLFASGITRSQISARVGNVVGSGIVELESPKFNEAGGMTVETTSSLINVININGIDIPEGIYVTLARVDSGKMAIVNFDRKCSVEIPGMGSLFFLTEFPRDPNGLDIKLGAWIDIPPNVHAWPEGTKAPEQVLCRSKEDPRHYKLFKYRREIEGTDWEDTGLGFGGTFTAESWESFSRSLDSLKSLRSVPDEEEGA